MYSMRRRSMTPKLVLQPPITRLTIESSKSDRYGWRNLRIGGCLSRPWTAYVILCLCTFIQNFSVNGANNAVISTLERVFYLNSVQSGLFLALYDLATALSSPLIGYLGTRYPSPIFFSLNMIIVGTGNILIACSNFLNRDPTSLMNPDLLQAVSTYNTILFQCQNDPLNVSNTTAAHCLPQQGSNAFPSAKVLLYIGNFVNGFGSVALFTIGIAYIERIFPKQRAAYCQGIYFAVGTVGGALGIVATGRFLKLFTALNTRQRLPSWLTPSHPLWIGCWWLPYFIYGACCFLIGIVVSGLPNFQPTVSSIPSIPQHESPTTITQISSSLATESRRPRLNQVIPSDTKTVTSTIWQNLKQMSAMILELLKNPRYLFIILGNLFEGILVKGFVPFITKYFEYQHQMDTSTATLVTGAIALTSVIIGCPIGAYLINRFVWSPRRCAQICSIVLIVSSGLFLFLLLSCPELSFDYSPCSTNNAFCCQNTYHPVCQVNSPERMFLSPCHFGCTKQSIRNDERTTFYSSCSCASHPNVTLSETACHFQTIPCTVIFVLTMAGATFVVFFTALIQVPMLQVLLYSVPLQYQSMALGLRQTIVRVLGQTTGPLLFGYVFDQSCRVWLTDCLARRTCKVYDNRRMGLSMALSGFSARFISGLAFAIVYLHWKYRNTEEVTSHVY